MTGIRVLCTVVVVVAGAGPARAQWIGATSGTTDDAAHSYLNTANWTGGTVSDTFGPTLTGPASFYFNNNRSTTGTFTITYGGTANVSLLGTGGNRTITLGGNVTVNATVAGASLVIGNATSGRRLNFDLGGATRTFTIEDSTAIVNPITGIGGLIKQGGGNLQLQGANTYTGTTTVSAGVLQLGGSAGMVPGDVVVNAATLLFTRTNAAIPFGPDFACAIADRRAHSSP